MKKQPTKKVICIERADNFIRCFLCESKYEALERCISQDDYKYPRKYFDTSTKQNICVKYRFNDVNKFIIFINNKFNPLWINIYYRTGEQKNKLAYTWGRNKGLQSAY